MSIVDIDVAREARANREREAKARAEQLAAAGGVLEANCRATGHVSDWKDALACVGHPEIGPVIRLVEGPPEDPGPVVAYVVRMG